MGTTTLLIIGLFLCSSASAQEQTTGLKHPVLRTELLTAMIAPGVQVSEVKIQEVILAPGVRAPLHLHPCPTMGVVSEGRISFQIEGKETQYLGEGDVFYEPANVRVVKFNNDGDSHAKFVVFYLLGAEQQETIRLLTD